MGALSSTLLVHTGTGERGGAEREERREERERRERGGERRERRERWS
jgi:hypothetical protein